VLGYVHVSAVVSERPQGQRRLLREGAQRAGRLTEVGAARVGCAVCIDVANEAMQMTRSGASVRDIRAAIEPNGIGRVGHTPTPMPHAGH